MKLKKFEQKDRHGNAFSIEFENAVPEMTHVPHPGGPRGTDTVPAWLTPGEFVVNKEATDMYGPVIEKMNNHGRQVQASYKKEGGYTLLDTIKHFPEYAWGTGREGEKIRKKMEEARKRLREKAKDSNSNYFDAGGIAVPTPRPEVPDVPQMDATELYQMLRSRGFNDVAARGIVANFKYESNLDPDARQMKGGPGRGLAQWEAGGRFDTDPLNLVDFARERGTSWKSPATQLDFMMAEMDRSDEYGAVRTAMNNAETPGEAAKIFLEGYEKANPKHKTYKDSMANRMAFASDMEIDEPSIITKVAGLFGSTPAQAAEMSPEMVNMTVPEPKPEPPAMPVVSAMAGSSDATPVTSTILDQLAAARAQYKAPGGEVDDTYRQQWEELVGLAQKATERDGMYVGDEVLDEGGTSYDADRHAAEIEMMKKMRRDAAVLEDAAATEAAYREASTPPPIMAPPSGDSDDLGTAPTGPRTVGKLFDNDVFTGEDGEYIIGPDGEPVFLNDDQMAAVQGRAPKPEVSKPEVPKPEAKPGDDSDYHTEAFGHEIPKPADPKQPKQGSTWLDPSSNIVYTINEHGQLINSYGHPAPAGVQDTYTQIQAGLLKEEDADPTKVVKPYENNTSESLDAEIAELEAEAQRQVAETGSVETETATAIAQKKGQNTQVTKIEIDNTNAAEAERLEIAKQNRERLESEYEEAKRIAEASGVTNFPSFDEWKNRSGNAEVDTDTETKRDGATTPDPDAGQKSEVLTELQTQVEEIDDGSADGQTEDDAQKKVDESGDDGQQKVKQAEGFFASIFGDLFDSDELKRMAVLYAGSRLLGASHGGALNWAAKGYLNRVDAKAAERTQTAKELLKGGKYTAKSIAEYKKSGDLNVLIPVGAKVNSTGDRQAWYTPNGKRVQAEKYKVGDSYIWSYDGGKTAIPASWHQDAARVPGTDKYNDRVRAETGLLKDSLKELSIAIGDVTPGDSEKGIKRTQKTNITPTNAALEAAQWAAKNGIDVAQMNTYVEQAYRMAVQQSGGENQVKPDSLLPYLNQLKLRQDTGTSELFTVTNKDGAEVPMDARKVEELSLQFLRRAGGTGAISDGMNRDAVNMFWNKAAEIWAKKVRETPDIVKQYQEKAQPGETAFYAYAREQLSLPVK